MKEKMYTILGVLLFIPTVMLWMAFAPLYRLMTELSLKSKGARLAREHVMSLHWKMTGVVAFNNRQRREFYGISQNRDGF